MSFTVACFMLTDTAGSHTTMRPSGHGSARK